MTLPVTPLCENCNTLLCVQMLRCPNCNSTPPILSLEVRRFVGYHAKRMFSTYPWSIRFCMYTGLLVQIKGLSIHPIVEFHFFQFVLKTRKNFYKDSYYGIDLFRRHVLKIATGVHPKNKKIGKRVTRELSNHKINNYINDNNQMRNNASYF